MKDSLFSQKHADALRIVVFGIWALKFALDPIQGLANLPDSVFNPPFPLQALPDALLFGLLAYESLIVLKVLGVMVSILCFFRRFVPYAAGFCFLLALTYQCLVRGYGHTNHAEVISLLAVLVYGLYAWFGGGRRDLEPFAIALLLCFSYVLIGAHRIAVGGWEIFTSNTVSYWAVFNSSNVTYFDFRFGHLAHSFQWFGWVLNLGFLWITICELFAPLALVRDRFRVVFLTSMVGFHVGVLLLMNIMFWENTVLLVAVFAPLCIRSFRGSSV